MTSKPFAINSIAVPIIGRDSLGTNGEILVRRVVNLISKVSLLVVAAAFVPGCGGASEDVEAPFAAAKHQKFAPELIRPEGAAAASAPLRTSSGRLTLDQVRSFEYALATNMDTPGIAQMIATSGVDMILTGGGFYDSPVNRSAVDPSGQKLIFGYIDVVEAAEYAYPELFAGGTLPSWFGKEHTGFPGLYTVQYWRPEWEQALLLRIDRIIANGYDGVFLDVLDGNSLWSAGNTLGNPAYSDALPALIGLVGRIRSHVSSKNLTQPFYLIGNNPTGIALADPAALRNLDGIFHEFVFWGPSATDGMVTEYQGTTNAQWVATSLAAVYKASGLPVFGNDYPLPLSNPELVLPSVQFYSELGWVPSVITAATPKNIFSTGPFVFMAVPGNPVVTGRTEFRNFLSGGLTPAATLTGGDQADYFVGGPGQNMIFGQGGDDVVYAHPAPAAFKNQLEVRLASTIRNTTPPSAAIRVNGTQLVAPTPITSAWGHGAQTFLLNVAGLGPITSLEILVSGTSYVNDTAFSNVSIDSIKYHGEAVSRATGSYPNGGASPGFYYTNNGIVTFPASSFADAPQYAANTSSVIDGGTGLNTVVYRGAYDEYDIARQADGAWRVTAARTAEGPDTLTNIQRLVFTDREVELQSGPTISNARVFAFAAATFPDLFAGEPEPGTYQQFNYGYFPSSQNYLAVDTMGGIWVLGPYTANALTFVGMLSNYAQTILNWEQVKTAR